MKLGKYAVVCVLLVWAVLVAGPVQAAPVVTGYDIQNAMSSGYGGWHHVYDGTITPISGYRANYAGGGGTMNDGLPGTSEQNTQLFDIPSGPVITVYLDQPYYLTDMMLLAFDSGNQIPGNMTGVNVQVGGFSQFFNTTLDYGVKSEYVNFVGSGLELILTDTVVLSGFVSSYTHTTYFCISEIEFNGGPVVPIPAAIWLLGSGLIGLAAWRRKSGR